MEKNFVQELKWRNMIQDIMPGTEDTLAEGMKTGYIGFDPTAASLTVGNLVALMLLKHFQECGHKPIIVMGGATGMIGDPSGKLAERQLLSFEIIQRNMTAQEKQIRKFLRFDDSSNSAEIVNNYDWFKDITLLDFLRDVGKHLTINYMTAKDSVKSRLESGLSFTEFSYQLLQGYDFYHLYQEKGCTLQMGGSDQWGNITAGTELIRRMSGGEAFAITTPLLTKADGTKFGKSEQGNIWLDPALTSPYHFYQFWVNSPDAESVKYLKYFTILTKKEINDLEIEHERAPHTRVLQKALAKLLTISVHSVSEYEMIIKSNDILFGAASEEDRLNFLQNLENEFQFIQVFSGIPEIDLEVNETGNRIDPQSIIDFLLQCRIFPSKSEARKMVDGGGISINLKKVDASFIIEQEVLKHGRWVIVQKGKKNYYRVQLRFTSRK